MEISPKISPTLLTLLFFSSLVSLSSSSPLISRRLSIQDTSSTALDQQFLIPHNIERSKVGLPHLKWSKKIANFASWWANRRRGDCALIHSSNNNYGENLFWGSGKDWEPGDAVAAWAAENGYYNYNSNSCTQNKDCLHYTQMVWRQSLKVWLCKSCVFKWGHINYL